MKLSHLLFSSFLLVPFHAHAMDEDPYAIAGRYAQQLQVAATAQQTRPTDETLKTYFQAYGASEAASRLLVARGAAKKPLQPVQPVPVYHPNCYNHPQQSESHDRKGHNHHSREGSGSVW